MRSRTLPGCSGSGVPAARMTGLARYGLTSKAPTLKRLEVTRQTATLLAAVRHLETATVDDALDLLHSLMATQLAADGFPVTDALLARFSPLQYDHINFLGRYAFTRPPVPGLRCRACGSFATRTATTARTSRSPYRRKGVR
ncbi:hypothetical protein ACIQJT_41590 [Streptomyces sp. NPDC091972]|uniref:hypothetical protein n=1 Tax=Streptomyces sp. NPDC091972 TaxID=3366007 RepID=UPI003801AFD9